MDIPLQLGSQGNLLLLIHAEEWGVELEEGVTREAVGVESFDEAMIEIGAQIRDLNPLGITRAPNGMTLLGRLLLPKRILVALGLEMSLPREGGMEAEVTTPSRQCSLK